MPIPEIAWYAAQSPTRPLTVFFIHGGFWREKWDRDHAIPLAQRLARDGMTVALPEYVRVGMSDGGWRGIVASVRDQLGRCLREVDGPLVVAGHSAGGHLALLATAGLVDPPTPAGVVSLAGVADLALADRLGLGEGAVRDFLLNAPGHRGDTPLPVELRPELEAADPAARSYPCPVILLSGDADVDVPPSLSASFVQRQPAGARVHHEVLAADHYAFIDPGTAAYDVLVRSVRTLAYP